MQLISYIRVSTQKQGLSGLGIEAQAYGINAFAQAERAEIVAQYVEVETGKGADALEQRPQLAAALAHCKRIGAVLVVAKLDRLTRNVEFGASLLNGKIKFRVAEMPHADNFQLHIMLAVAEKERDLISQRTKQALQAAKARGTVLGNAKQAAANAADARAYAEGLRDVIAPVMCQSSRQIAAFLNARGIKTVTGSSWASAQVLRLIARLQEEDHVAVAA